MTTINQIPRNQRYQEEESVYCHQCGIGFHCTDAGQMTTSVYWHFEGEAFCGPSCLHDRKNGVRSCEWRKPPDNDEFTGEEFDDYGYPMSIYND